MTDPAGVAQDPRQVLMMGDEPDTVAELMALADEYAVRSIVAGIEINANKIDSTTASRNLATYRLTLQNAIRAALEAQQP